jgi:hypothetical protein
MAADVSVACETLTVNVAADLDVTNYSIATDNVAASNIASDT